MVTISYSCAKADFLNPDYENFGSDYMFSRDLLSNKQKGKPYTLFRKHWRQQKERSAGKPVDFIPPFKAAHRFLAVISMEDGKNWCVILGICLWQVTIV